MKNHRFPWLRNRTTDNRKCEKACNIKEKRTIEMFNTVYFWPELAQNFREVYQVLKPGGTFSSVTKQTAKQQKTTNGRRSLTV